MIEELTFIKNKFDLYVSNLSFVQLLSIIAIGIFIMGLCAGNIIGTYYTTIMLTDLINKTANENTSLLQLDNLQGYIGTYQVYHYQAQTMNATISIEIGK